MAVPSTSPKNYSCLVSRMIKNTNQKYSFRITMAVGGQFFTKLKQKRLMAKQNMQQKSEKKIMF